MKKAWGCFSLFDCLLNEFILTSNHHPGQAELSNWKEQLTPCDQGPLYTQASLHPFHFAQAHHQVAEKPPQCWAHPFRKRRWDVLHEFKYLGTEYIEVSQNTYFSLGERKSNNQTLVSPCPSMHHRSCRQPALSWGALSDVRCTPRQKEK